MSYIRNNTSYLFIILVCYISKLPLLTDKRLLLDGDECVVALMAKHTYLGKGLSLFFWGQDYGFSLIEILFIVPFYALLGYTTIAVKLAMLTLWSIGIIFFYKTMLAINSTHKVFAILLTTLLILSPTWMNWAMEARGGYLTSFTLNAIALYILFTPTITHDILRYTLIGFLICIIYLSQPLWLSGVLPLIGYKLLGKRSLRNYTSLAISFAVTYFTISILKSNTAPVYDVHTGFPVETLISNIKRFPEYLYKSLQGNYSFGWYQETPWPYKVYAGIASTLLYSLALLSLLHLLFNKKEFSLFIASTIFIPIAFTYSLIPETMQGRYLLPMIGFALLSLYIYSTKLRMQTLLNGAMIVLVAITARATITMPLYFNGQSNREELTATLSHLKKHNITNLYATNTMLPWEIMFYSNEQIRCRSFYFPGRNSHYDTLVDKAFFNGEKTAIIGHWKEYGGLQLDSLDFENHYFIQRNPTKELLESAFQFPIPDTFFVEKSDTSNKLRYL